MRVRHLLLAGLAAGLVAAAPATAAIPASGTLVEGVGPPGLSIGTPVAAAKRAFGLWCAPTTTAAPFTRCYNTRRGSANYIQVGGDGRIEAFVANQGGWRTRAGVGLGSRIAAVRAAYGSRLKVRANATWTYMDLRQVIRGQPHVTSFLGRTKVGDVVQLVVTRERRRAVSVAPAAVQAGQAFRVRLADFDPRLRFEVSFLPPWERVGRDEPLGTVRVGRDGNGALTVSTARGALALALAQRPPGVTSPVELRLFVEGFRAVKARVKVALPPPPSFAIDLPTISRDAPGTLTVTGPEPRAEYTVDAEWTCPTGAARREAEVQEDPLAAPAAGPATGVVDVGTFAFDLFDPACAGESPPAALPVRLVLFRVGFTASRRAVRERMAELTVGVANPASAP